MYLEHFKFSELPFGLTPNVGFFCHLKGHQEALNVLIFCLTSGEGFIKIVGEVGSGKTLLCRKLLSSLSEEFFTAYIPNPDLQPIELRAALARELAIDSINSKDQHELQKLINDRLMQLHQSGKRIVLLIDEAQALPSESLEALRLLTNLETEKNKLLQVVLFGQPELDVLLDQTKLRQLKQRITFSYYLPIMSRDDLDTYLFHRLNMAGYSLGSLFNKKARDLLFRASKGVPRVVNILCHKALLIAYGRGEHNINWKIMRLAVNDSEIDFISNRNFATILIGIIVSMIVIIFFYYSQGII